MIIMMTALIEGEIMEREKRDEYSVLNHFNSRRIFLFFFFNFCQQLNILELHEDIQ